MFALPRKTAALELPRLVDDWIARLRLIPDETREFVVDLRQADLEFGFAAPSVHELVARGLPHLDDGDGLRLAGLDLHYVGLRLGCATLYLTVMRNWARALTGSAASDTRKFQIRCTPYAATGTEVTVLVPPGERRRARIGPDRVAVSFDVCTRGSWPALDPALVGLWEDVAALDFCWIPDALHDDADFVRRTGISDCTSAAYLLAGECTRRGIEARTSFGLLLAPPYSTPHNWVELRDLQGRWVPWDPLLLALLERFAGLDGSAWPPVRSPGGVLVRLDDRETALVLAGEEPIDATFLTAVREPAGVS